MFKIPRKYLLNSPCLEKSLYRKLGASEPHGKPGQRILSSSSLKKRLDNLPSFQAVRSDDQQQEHRQQQHVRTMGGSCEAATRRLTNH